MVVLKTVATFISESLSTGLLVVCSCLSIHFLGKSNITLSAVYGLSQFVIMNCFGQISGAHSNPAICLGLWWQGLMSITKLIIYVSGQITGAAVGHFMVNSLLGTPVTDSTCTFQPKSDMEDLHIFGVEFLCTFMLVLSWCSLWKYDNISLEASMAVVNTVIYLIGGQLTGASANPARTIAPCFFIGRGKKTHIYLAGELLGAIAAPFLLNRLRC